MSISLRIASVLSLSCGLLFISSASAASFYTTSGQVSAPEIGLTGAAGAFDTEIAVTNTGSQSLYNLYFLSNSVSINGPASLVGPGVYQDSSADQASATNAAVYILPSQTNASFSSGDAGSTVVPEVPAFFIASVLNPGQTVDFYVDFQTTPPAGALNFGGFYVQSDAPEPGPFMLFAVGLAALGVLRRVNVSKGSGLQHNRSR